MDTLQFRGFDFLGIDQFSLAPEPDFRNLVIEGVNTQINLFMGVSVNLELQRANGDLSIRIYGSVQSETEDILGRRVGGWNFEFTEERPLLVQSSLKTEIRDLLGGRVNLSVVISMDFLPKDLLGGFDVGDIFSDADSGQSVLEPAIRAFHFPFRLWRQGIGDFDMTIIQDLLPLRRGLIGQQEVLSPEGVPSLDKSEDRMGIYIVAIREPVLKDDGLEGQDMSPGGFLFDQSGIKDQTAIIIQGSDEIPLLLSCGCPEVIGGVMLDQLPHVTG